MSLLEIACPHCGKSIAFSPIDYINTAGDGTKGARWRSFRIGMWPLR